VARLGAGVARLGAGVARLGAGVARLGAGVARLGAGVAWLGVGAVQPRRGSARLGGGAPANAWLAASPASKARCVWPRLTTAAAAER
jgi:hypothetical protein